jgi:enoyl-CoA hydratase/carnithine racemase
MMSSHPNEPIEEYPEVDELERRLDDDGVLLVTFNRPERNNAWTYELEDAYFQTLLAAANDPRVRVIVVTGAGKSFCPGMDMDVLAASAKGQKSGLHRRWPMTTALHVPKPVIGAINGACAGIGFIHLTTFDVAFVAAGAKLTTSFARRGLPAENGVAWLLPRRIGTVRAMDLLLSGRVISAEEAGDLGLVNWVVDGTELLDRTLAYARDMARNCSPASMAHIKRQVLGDWEHSAEEARFRSLVLISEMGAHPDFAEGVISYRERRAPRFEGHDAHLHVAKSINR